MMESLLDRWRDGRQRLKRLLRISRRARRNGVTEHHDYDDISYRFPLVSLLTRRCPRHDSALLRREDALPYNRLTVYGAEDYYFGLRYAAAMALPTQSIWDGPDLSNADPQDRSPFFRKMPLEIRNMIYEHLLMEETGRPLPRYCPTHPSGMTHSPCYHVAILRTCKRAYAEVQYVFRSTMAQRYWFTMYPPPKEYNMLYVQRPLMVEHRRHSVQKQWQLEPSDEYRRYAPRRAPQVEIYAEIGALSRPPTKSNAYDLTCLFAFSDFLREELRPRVLKLYLHESSFSYGSWPGQLGKNLSTEWFRHLILPRSVKEMVVQMDFVEVFSFHNPQLYLDLAADHQRLSKMFAALKIRVETADKEKKKQEYLTLDKRMMQPLLPECSDVLRKRSLSSLLSFTFTYRRQGKLLIEDCD